MVQKHLFLNIIMGLTLFALSTSTLEASDLDKYKEIDSQTPYYAPLLFNAYGQRVKNTEEISFGITSVSVNNEIIDIPETKEIQVSKDDAVRIAGKAEPKTKVSVYFADKKIEVYTKEDGNWLVLFSITKLNESRYVVTANHESLRENPTLFNLVIGNGKQVIEPILDSSVSQGDSFLDKKGEILAFVGVAIISTLLGWILGSHKQKKNIKIKAHIK